MANPQYFYSTPQQAYYDPNLQIQIQHQSQGPAHQIQPVYVPQNQSMQLLQPQYQYPVQSILPQYHPPSTSKTNDEEWQMVQNKKRARTSPEQHFKLKQTRIDNYWLSTPTANKFNVLINEDAETEEAQKQKQEEKPPPIFIAGVKNIQPLNQLLNTIAKDKHLIRVLNEEQVKVQAQTNEIYDNIVKALDEKQTEYHTYRKKQDKPFRVVIRHIHPTVDIQEIKKEIESQGHIVLQITNILQRTTKKPLPLFFVDLKMQENNKDIYKMEYLFNAKIDVEAPRLKRELAQCTRCQRYGHTKNFCYHQYRCVKCALNHPTADCPRKIRSDLVKCVLCGNNHPANYRGCSVHKKLQEARFPTLRKKESPNQLQNQQLPVAATNKSTTQRPTYAQIVSTNQQEIPTVTQTNDIQELKNMMKGLMEQMSTMLNLLTTLVSKMN